MTSSTEVMLKVYCKYFEKALCLRDDVTKCEECPYYKLIDLLEDEKVGKSK